MLTGPEEGDFQVHDNTQSRTGTQPARRTRRTATELKQLILDAAREEFRAIGYDLATTKSIARRAGVSESLLFRYFGQKSSLLEAAALAPFHAMIAQYYLENSEPNERRPTEFTRNLTAYLWQNRLLLVRLLCPRPDGAESGPDGVNLGEYFSRATDVLTKLHDKRGIPADPRADLSVRLAFGMVLSSVLFSEWLFDDTQPMSERERALEANLARMLQTDLA